MTNSIVGLVRLLVRLWPLVVRLALLAVSIAWPAFASIQAMESKHTLDDTQWLSYWIVFGLYQTLETLLLPVTRYIPLYRELKVLTFAYMSLPHTRGAAALYRSVRPQVLQIMSFVRAKHAEVVRKTETEGTDEVAKLKLEIADVQDAISSAFRTDLETFRAKQDRSELDHKMNTIKGALALAYGTQASRASKAGVQNVNLQQSDYEVSEQLGDGAIDMAIRLSNSVAK